MDELLLKEEMMWKRRSIIEWLKMITGILVSLRKIIFRGLKRKMDHSLRILANFTLYECLF